MFAAPDLIRGPLHFRPVVRRLPARGVQKRPAFAFLRPQLWQRQAIGPDGELPPDREVLKKPLVFLSDIR
jgi:hypothetical protein